MALNLLPKPSPGAGVHRVSRGGQQPLPQPRGLRGSQGGDRHAEVP